MVSLCQVQIYRTEEFALPTNETSPAKSLQKTKSQEYSIILETQIVRTKFWNSDILATRSYYYEGECA